MSYLSPSDEAELRHKALAGEKAEALEEVLRRYIIAEKLGKEALYDEFGVPTYPNSSISCEEWNDRVLRVPAKYAISRGILVCSCSFRKPFIQHKLLSYACTCLACGNIIPGVSPLFPAE